MDAPLDVDMVDERPRIQYFEVSRRVEGLPLVPILPKPTPYPIVPTPLYYTYPNPAAPKQAPNLPPLISKPKSTAKVPRPPPRTSSPPPPPAVPPLKTIRLDIQLGGPDNYTVDIFAMAKETGQHPETPPPEIHSDAEVEDEPQRNAQADDGGEQPKKKAVTHRLATETYDVHDPFIDDSELSTDQRTWFAQTKHQGFYVSAGEVAIVRDKAKRRPKSTRSQLSLTLSASPLTLPEDSERPVSVTPVAHSAATPAAPDASVDAEVTSQPSGDAPLARLSASQPPASQPSEPPAPDESSVQVGQKRKRYITVQDESGKKRKIVDVNSFHPELQLAIQALKEASQQEDWSEQGKFPSGLKLRLAEVAMLAVRLGEYDEHFFKLMPTLFPYNTFTMTKLIKRMVYPDHMKLLQERSDLLMKELEREVKVSFPKAEEEYYRTLAAWKKRQEKYRREASGSGTATPPASNLVKLEEGGSTRQSSEEADTSMDVDGNSGSVTAAGSRGPSPLGLVASGDGGPPRVITSNNGALPPQKKVRLTDALRTIIWELVLVSNELCRLENEKNELEGSLLRVSDQSLRKSLYQKICAVFPEGWMNSGYLSRDVSATKKRLEKEQAGSPWVVNSSANSGGGES